MTTRVRVRAAAFFDLDKTIIATSSTLAFSRPFFSGGLLTRGALLRSAYAQLLYSVQGADHDQLERMREYVSDLCAGWEVEQVQRIVEETLHDLITPIVYREATDLIAEHRAAGRDVIIVSASGYEMVEPIGQMLGADHVVATRMRVADGRYTGDIDFYAYGPHKVTAIRELADERGYDLTGSYAYSDSMTDLPMLEEIGHPFAVNPDRALRRIALERDWPVLEFTHTGRVDAPRATHRIPTPRTPTIALGAGAATATAAGLVWFANRRRDRSFI